MKLFFSPAASEDLMDIAVHIAQDNPSAALNFIDKLESSCDRLAAAPGIGTARPELGVGVRMWPYGNYLIFYRADKEVRIERVLHGARDIGIEDIEGTDFDEGH